MARVLLVQETSGSIAKVYLLLPTIKHKKTTRPVPLVLKRTTDTSDPWVDVAQSEATSHVSRQPESSPC